MTDRDPHPLCATLDQAKVDAGLAAAIAELNRQADISGEYFVMHERGDCTFDCSFNLLALVKTILEAAR